MTAPACAVCQRREEFGARDICGCDPDQGVAWACLAARKVSGPCGPDGRLYLGPVDEPAAPLPPKPRSYWISRRAGCLAAAGICIVFWLTVILWATLGR